MAKNNNTQFYAGDTVNLAMAKLTTLHSTTKWLYFKDSTHIDAVTIFENYKDAFGLKKLPKGIYFIQFLSDVQKITKKIIKL